MDLEKVFKGYRHNYNQRMKKKRIVLILLLLFVLSTSLVVFGSSAAPVPTNIKAKNETISEKNFLPANETYNNTTGGNEQNNSPAGGGLTGSGSLLIGGSLAAIIAAIIFVSLVTYIYFTVRVKIPKKLLTGEAKEKEVTVEINPETDVGKINPELKAALGVLNEREREIINTILEHGGKTTMSRIYHQTGIPPTTLFRWVHSLENRGLIKTTKTGKIRRIYLSKKYFPE